MSQKVFELGFFFFERENWCMEEADEKWEGG